MARRAFFAFALLVPVLVEFLAASPAAWRWVYLPYGVVVAVGLYDMLQQEHTLLRNYPVLGHGRYLMEFVRPGVQQYFVESNWSGRPVPREYRALIYQRSKNEEQTVAFGTQRDVYTEGYEWVDHTLEPIEVHEEGLRVQIGGGDCSQPYSASVLNISAMSYGSLSAKAIQALNGGARAGGFAHNTGEGGLSPHHLAPGGDLIWQIGTGYFGCRDREGRFSEELFREQAARPSVRMIELKLSQGAKPGKGGILPAAKLTEEIAAIRHVPRGKDVISPPAHTAFSGPIGLLQFVAKLRELSGGKPTGFKLCIGKRHEFLAICKAMLETGIRPDYIAVDGGEGATGAAPLEFTDSVGTPLDDGLAFVIDALEGFCLKREIPVMAGGRIFTAFHLLSKLAIGADLGYSARGFMLSLGCIHALECNLGTCPTGITTHDPTLTAGLVVPVKSQRVRMFQHETVHALAALMGAAGVDHPTRVDRTMVWRRVSWKETVTYAELFPPVPEGSFLEGGPPERYRVLLARARADRFAPST